MKLPHRRQFLHLAAGTAALPAVSRFAWAQTYPSRPVRIIVGQAAGSGSDIIARLIGQSLSERLGQQFIIENRPGAGGNIATEVAVRSAPDGYTLLLVSSSHAINSTLYDNLKFNIVRDLAPIAAVASVPNVMVINPALSAKTILEFIAYAKANPGRLNLASGGNGTSSHLAGELFKMMAGINLVHIPYRGQPPALTDLLGGQVQVSFAPMPPSIEHIRAGKLLALAVTTPARWEALPDLPAMAEFLPGYEASTWFGVGAPKNTSTEIVDRINREVNAGLANPKIKAQLADLGATVFAGSPADFGRHVAEETEKWAKVVRFAGIKPE